MKKGCSDTNIWDDVNERGSIAEDFEKPVMLHWSESPRHSV